MMFDIKTVAAAALAFASLGNCHMIMARPVPYGVSTLNNSPLVDAAIGSAESDFPCKQRPGVYDITTMNHIEVGTPQELSFIGSASHGGGTCQLAITKDKEPTASSTFKLFQVFEGGCPVSSDGNTGSHPFTFEVPKEMPNGVMTFAWIWYNRIGNRELYMNCAPVTITGGSSSDTFFNSLPNAYIVNMPTSECQTSFQGIQNAVTIPHPGQFIMKQTAGQEVHAADGPGCAAAAAKMLEGVVGYKGDVVQNGASYNPPAGAPPSPSGGAVSGSPSGYAAAPSAPASAGPSQPAGSGYAAAPSASGSPSQPAGSGYAAAPSASGSPSQPAGSGYAAAPSASGFASAPAPSQEAPSAQASSGAVNSGYAPVPSSQPSQAAPAPPTQSGSACSSTGDAMTCSSDGKSFGVCAEGKMVWRAMAPGTTCQNGQVVRRREHANRHMGRHQRRRGRRAL